MELVEKYVALTYTINDRIIDNIKTDSDELIKEINNVAARVELTLEANTKVLCDDDIERLVKVTKTIYIPNFEAKDKLYKYVLTLSKTIEEITEHLKIEEDERMLEQRSRRLYDGKEELKDAI